MHVMIEKQNFGFGIFIKTWSLATITVLRNVLIHHVRTQSKTRLRTAVLERATHVHPELQVHDLANAKRHDALPCTCLVNKNLLIPC